MKKLSTIRVILFVLPAFCSLSPLYAFETGLPPMEESAAFQEYQKRPSTDLSKLIYLIDRFKEAQIEIVYEGMHVKPFLAANVAKWFLAKQYRGQKPKEWILQWCDVTVPRNNPIYVKGVDGDFARSRKILFDELEALEKASEEAPPLQTSA